MGEQYQGRRPGEHHRPSRRGLVEGARRGQIRSVEEAGDVRCDRLTDGELGEVAGGDQAARSPVGTSGGAARQGADEQHVDALQQDLQHVGRPSGPAEPPHLGPGRDPVRGRGRSPVQSTVPQVGMGKGQTDRNPPREGDQRGRGTGEGHAADGHQLQHGPDHLLDLDRRAHGALTAGGAQQQRRDGPRRHEDGEVLQRAGEVVERLVHEDLGQAPARRVQHDGERHPARSGGHEHAGHDRSHAAVPVAVRGASDEVHHRRLGAQLGAVGGDGERRRGGEEHAGTGGAESVGHEEGQRQLAREGHHGTTRVLARAPGRARDRPGNTGVGARSHESSVDTTTQSRRDPWP
jgi:hypothetical protein